MMRRVMPGVARIDPVILVSALALSALGVLFIGSATIGTKFEGLAGRQTIFIGIGLVAMTAAILFDYRMLLKFSFPIYCVCLLPLVYLLLWRFVRRRRQLRLVAAFCVGFAWLFLLGGDDGPLSPCRLADGTPTAAADDSVREELRTSKARLSAAEADALVAHGRSAESVFCFGGVGRGRCYEYAGRVKGKPVMALAMVDCDGSSWRAQSVYLGAP